MHETLNFKAVTIENRQVITKYLNKLEFKNSELSFTNIFSWAKPYNTQFTIFNDFLILKSSHGTSNTQTFSFPIGIYEKNMDKLKDAICLMFKTAQEEGGTFILRIHDPYQIQFLGSLFADEFVITKDIDSYDYVYNSEDLIELKGKKYHGKKNHINKFVSLYDYEYRHLTAENIPEAKGLFDAWCKTKADMDDIDEDITVAYTLFDNFEELEIVGGGIFVDGNMVAFSFGEALNNCMVDIHAEYASADYQGIFPLINQQFVKNEWSKYKYINREDDMGLDGLRKAKRSYNPVMMLEKYYATFE